MIVIRVDDIKNVEVPKAPKIYCETSYHAGFRRAIDTVLAQDKVDVGVVPVTITDNTGKTRPGYYDKTHELIFLASMSTEFAKGIGLEWKASEQPFGGAEP